MSIVVENYQSVKTVPQLFELVGEKTCARWEELGRLDSKIHWNYGIEADQLIAEGIHAMLVYKAIAIKAGKSSQTIRKAYYTYKAFTAEQREKYKLCPYSVFAHARTQKKPEVVLQYYLDNMASVDEVETVFPVIEDEEFEKEFSSKGYPRMFYGIYREAYGIDPFLRARIEEHLQGIAEILKQVEAQDD